MAEKIITLNELKSVTDDIYNKISNKTDRETVREYIENQPDFASPEEVKSLIPASNDKVLVLAPSYGTPMNTTVLLEQYFPGGWKAYNAYIKENNRLPWDVIDCRYVNTIQFMLDEHNTGNISIPKMPKIINTNNVKTMYYLFAGNDAITTVQAFDSVAECTNYTYMFNYCTNLKEIPDIPYSYVSRLNTDHMFCYCSKLEKAPRMGIDFIKTTHMFAYCKSLKEVPEYDLSQCRDMSGMFLGCESLPEEFPWEIDMSSVGVNKSYSSVSAMFTGSSVRKVTLKNVPQILNPASPKSKLGNLSLEQVLGYGPAGPLEIAIKNYLSW